jgi:hypothetical protein
VAKVTLGVSGYREWRDAVLKKSRQWCSTHRRIYEERENISAALSWAVAHNHRYANCFSVERVLKLICDFRRWNENPNAPAEGRTRAKIVDVKRLLKQTNDLLAKLRESISHEVENAEAVLDNLDVPIHLDNGFRLVSDMCCRLRVLISSPASSARDSADRRAFALQCGGSIENVRLLGHLKDTKEAA